MSDFGLGIILTSDTLEETIGLSHNIIIMKDGEIKKLQEMSGSPLDKEQMSLFNKEENK